jgi:CubicO group peptidase (beta-lactamase class C family)
MSCLTKSVFVAAVAVVLVSFSLPVETASAQTERVDEYVKEQMEKRQVPGLALAVLQGGRVVKARGYGLANVEHSVPVIPNTVFQSGSVGKQFTSAAVMMLMEEERIGLDDPIDKYLAKAPDIWKDITVRHLLNHTSGIREYEEQVDYRRDFTEEEFVRMAAEHPLDFSPGEHWSYSNTGYVLLGVIVGKVTGRHWGEFVQERIFDQVGMKTARVISDADIVPNRAAGYTLIEGELKNQECVSPFFNSTADGALHFSVLDMANWDATLYTEELLTSESKEAMWTPVTLNGGKKVNYGFGWALNEIRGHRIIEHSGHWQGFAAFIARYVSDSLTVVVLANQGELSPGAIAHGVAGIYVPELRPVERRAITLVPEKLDAYVGLYEFPSHTLFTVTREGEKLFGSWGEGEKRELLAESDGEFFYEDRETRLEFVKNERGETVWLLMDWGVEEEARRIQ